MNNSKIKDNPGLYFFGNQVDLECRLQDLKLIQKSIEAIEFDNKEKNLDRFNEEGLINDCFPDISRKSFIITLIIIMENEFRNFCELLRIIENLDIKWNQLRGTVLDRFLLYIQKISKLDCIIDNDELELIQGLIETRNCIVHSNSNLYNYNKIQKVEKFIAKIPGFDIEDYWICISYNACMICVDIVDSLMEKAYRAALNRYPYNS